MAKNSSVPWYIWPFIMIWRLAGVILRLVGRKAGIAIGVGLVLLGGFQSLSVIGAVIGIPVALIGAAVLLRAIKMPRK